MIATFLDDVRDHDLIAPRRLAERLRMPLSGLAKLARVNRNTMTAKPESPAVQAKLGQIAQIIARAAEMAGDQGVQVSHHAELGPNRRGGGGDGLCRRGHGGPRSHGSGRLRVIDRRHPKSDVRFTS